MPDFIPGLELCRRFFLEAVKPVLDAGFANVEYSAALIGSGSEVLGFDTAMSTDHNWGPRAMLFFHEETNPGTLDAIHETLRHRLPYSFLGYSTHFGEPCSSEEDRGTQLLETIDSGLVNHHVETFYIKDYFRQYLNMDIIAPADWLTITQQHLRSVTGGAVYHDDIGFQAIRDRFTYYPRDIWLYLMAASWTRIGQEEHLAPRAGFVGDELGASVIASRLVRDIMLLCFLMERQYAPYPKWFGPAFQQLECATDLMPLLSRVQSSETWQMQEKHLCMAYTVIAEKHNALNLTEPLPTIPVNFHGRPFRVIEGWRFSAALCKQIQDPEVKRIAEKTQIGCIDHFSDSTDLREAVSLRPTLRQMYD